MSMSLKVFSRLCNCGETSKRKGKYKGQRTRLDSRCFLPASLPTDQYFFGGGGGGGGYKNFPLQLFLSLCISANIFFEMKTTFFIHIVFANNLFCLPWPC